MVEMKTLTALGKGPVKISQAGSEQIFNIHVCKDDADGSLVSLLTSMRSGLDEVPMVVRGYPREWAA